MKQINNTLRTDLFIHLLCLAVQLCALIPSGFLQKGATLPLVYPCWLILAALTLHRQSESFAQYQSRLIYIPSILISILCGFCMINEMTRDFWAFALPRYNPVVVRIVWYQSCLLLIHPQIYPIIINGWNNAYNFLLERGYFGGKVWLTCAVVGVLMWLLRNQNLSPDGFDWLKHSLINKNWVNYLREPLGTFIFRLNVLFGIKAFHLAPYVSITLLTIICGFAATWLMIRVIEFAIDKPYRGLALASLISCCGYTQVFTGNVEIYALLQTGLALFLYSVIRYLRQEWPSWSVGIIFGGLFCLHLSAGWWLPAFLMLPLIKYLHVKETDSTNFYTNIANITTKNLLGDASTMLAAFCIFTAAFWAFVLFYGYHGDFMALWNHFWSDQVMNVGSDAAMFRQASDFISFDYYLTMLNEYFYLGPCAAILICIVFSGQCIKCSWTPFLFWTILLAGFYFIYTVLWHPDRAFPADWDIFSGLTIPILLVFWQIIPKRATPKTAICYTGYQSIVFSGLYLLLQLLRNHIKISEWPNFL